MAKKSKPEESNGVTVESVAPPVVTKPAVTAESAVAAHGPPPVDPSLIRLRDIKQEMEDEIRSFKDNMVSKYSSYQGHDLRKDVSWFMEQMGISISNDMERVKREERQRLIHENRYVK